MTNLIFQLRFIEKRHCVAHRKSIFFRFSSPRPPNLVLTGGVPPAPVGVSSSAAASGMMPSERKGSSGILRLDGAFSARRRGSAEPASPSPSADRLSVTFAMDDGGDADAVASANESNSDREREPTERERPERHQVRHSP